MTEKIIDKTTEIIKENLSPITERIKNPFVISFIFSYIAINWKPISTFIFLKVDILTKIDTIEARNYEHTTWSFWGPFCIALIYTLLLPLMRGLIKISSIISDYIASLSDGIAIKLFHRETILNTEKENIKEKNDLKKKLSEQERIIKNLSKELSDSRGSIELLNNEINQISIEKDDIMKAYKDEVNHYKHKLSLETIDKNRYRKDASIYAPSIYNMLSLELKSALKKIAETQKESPLTNLTFDIGLKNKLIENRLIEESKNENGENISIQLTPLGNQILQKIKDNPSYD
ncbi:hypothetical protein [Wenyingzhuangia sp. IMCC45467]